MTNWHSATARDNTASSITEMVRTSGLDPALLYEAVIELTDEGLLTAGCINAAAGILLSELGLPAYFFRNISKDALKRVLRAIGTNLQRTDGKFVLRGTVSEVQFDIDGGVQVRIATAQTRDRMEAVLNPVMAGRRVEYYFGHQRQYYTYIIRPETCKEAKDIAPGESPFAFAQPSTAFQMPQETRQRYENFLQRALQSVTPLVETSDSAPANETRVMFREDFSRSILPVVRKMLEDLGIRLNRAYWETFRNPSGRVESICSLYMAGRPEGARLQKALERLHALLAIQPNDLDQLFVNGSLSFDEYIFSLCAFSFVHAFIYKDQPVDREIMNGISRHELREAMAKRLFDSNRAEYSRKVILETMRARPELLKKLFSLFDLRFNPKRRRKCDALTLAREIEAFKRRAAILFIDDRTGYDIFAFLTRLITDTQKTNFYKVQKRSHAFRFGSSVLDPLVFDKPVYGVFFVVGFYATGMHMRAEDVARGGVRLVRVTSGNYENELDNMPLLNYALGPVAQRLKHKDIAESGAKGVIVPYPESAGDGLNAMLDFTEGILDLVQTSDEVRDYFGKHEMVFFGPDEGTAGFMDAIASRARERGYKHWRTIASGKSIGIPHDTYGLTRDGHIFGLIPRGPERTELELDGSPLLKTADMEKIHSKIGERIESSGMTTMGVMACLRVLLHRVGLKEEEVHLMMTGGPDGDLGANQIQSFKGKICLIVDAGSVLFDPEGLDRKELMKIAFARHTNPRLNSMAYPERLLSPRGFRVPRQPGRFKLPDGTVVEDGAFFHRNFLFAPENRKYAAQARLEAFVPCGGFKDTINATNVRDFIGIFKELRVIVEGANVFFDDAARETIARETSILQIKDSSANKGGVTCSSIAEVLAAFLLGKDYEKTLVQNPRVRCAFIREMFEIIARNARAETEMLLALHRRTGTPLYRLSVETSEKLYALQAQLQERLDEILARRDLVGATLSAYVPTTLLKLLGLNKVVRLLSAPDVVAYRNAIVTKKLAAMALYAHATEWEEFLKQLEGNFTGTLEKLVQSAR